MAALLPSSIIADETDNYTPQFEIVNDEVNLSMKHTSTGDFTPEQYLGVGQAWGDINNDGFDDLYLTSQDEGNQLLINQDGQEFITSEHEDDVTLESVKSGGAIFADYDNDGDQDLYVANHGKNALFRNDGDDGFTDVTDFAGVGDDKKGSSASWADFDSDGDLDLFVTNWMCDGCKDGPWDEMADKLYLNNGDGTFEDVSFLLEYEWTLGASFIGSWLDYDNDHDLDLYIVNDQYANPIGNVMFRNDGAGCDYWCFTEVSRQTGTDVYVYGMGLAIGDIDHDYDLDMYFSNMGEHVMLLNDGKGHFEDYTVKTNTKVGDVVGWATLFFDVDNDKYEDLFVSINMDDSVLFMNTGDGYFRESEIIYQDLHLQGAAYTDYNRDGWIDVIGGQRWGEYFLLENQGSNLDHQNNQWISFDFQGKEDITLDATGTRLYLKTSDGLGHMKEVHNGIGLGGGSSQEIHVGLADTEIEKAVILWPDGQSQLLEDFEYYSVNNILYAPDGNLGHQDIIDHLNLNPYHNPRLNQEQITQLLIVSSAIALVFVITVPIISIKLRKLAFKEEPII